MGFSSKLVAARKCNSVSVYRPLSRVVVVKHGALGKSVVPRQPLSYSHVLSCRGYLFYAFFLCGTSWPTVSRGSARREAAAEIHIHWLTQSVCPSSSSSSGTIKHRNCVSPQYWTICELITGTLSLGPVTAERDSLPLVSSIWKHLKHLQSDCVVFFQCQSFCSLSGGNSSWSALQRKF